MHTKTLIAFALIIHAELAISLSCDETMFEKVAPRFPNILGASHTIVRKGPCSVEINYDIESGLPINIEANVEKERCKVFIRSSVKALKRSKFDSTKNIKDCVHVFKFEIEEST